MVTLNEVIEVHRPIEDAFAYVSDFANSQRWDPGVDRSERADGGPVGVGATFRLVVRFRKTALPMTYRITQFDPPRRVVLQGEGSTVRAVDEIVLEPTRCGTRIRYRADLRMRGPLALVEPFLRGSFDAMGERAVAGLRAALDEPPATGAVSA